MNWSSSSCQVIGAGQLTTAMVNGVNDPNAWTVISRHGEYAQSETECNRPDAISVANGVLDIQTSKPRTAPVCGDWNEDGSLKASPASWPYLTGDIQANTFSFRYGTVITRARMPVRRAGVWPAVWFLAAGATQGATTNTCLTANKYSGDPNGNCPAYGTAGTYQEIDMVECKPGTAATYCQLVVHNPTYSDGEAPINPYLTDTNWHTYTMTWCPSGTNGILCTGSVTAGVYLYLDGGSSPAASVPNSTKASPNVYMFPIMQTQTTRTSDAGPPNDAFLPVHFQIDYIKICNTNYTAAQCTSAASTDANVIFYDDFAAAGSLPAAPTGLNAVVE